MLLPCFDPPAKHTVCVCQMCFLTWEIPADRYRRIGVHMWKLGRVPSLLCYTEDIESVSWASPGTCSQTPALLVFTVSVYRNCRLLSSACKGAGTESFTKADIHLPTIYKLRRYCSVSAFSFEQHGWIQHQGNSLNPAICLWHEAVNPDEEKRDESRSRRLSRITLTAWRQSSDPICLGI